MMFPGPHEPSQDQWNNVMEICVKHFQRLYNGKFALPIVAISCEQCLGMKFRVHGKDEPELFHVQIRTNVSDLPASRKTSGLLTYTSKYFMCDHCDVPFYALGDPDTYNSTSEFENVLHRI
jgi:hypothetical protein